MPDVPHNIHSRDVVALAADLPDKSLLRGQVGTVVEILSPGVFEVEFSDDQGRTYARLVLRDSQLLILRQHPRIEPKERLRKAREAVGKTPAEAAAAAGIRDTG